MTSLAIRNDDPIDPIKIASQKEEALLKAQPYQKWHQVTKVIGIVGLLVASFLAATTLLQFSVVLLSCSVSIGITSIGVLALSMKLNEKANQATAFNILTHLPNELADNITGYLSTKDLQSLSLVEKSISTYASSSLLKRTFLNKIIELACTLRNNHIKLKTLIRFAQYFKAKNPLLAKEIILKAVSLRIPDYGEILRNLTPIELESIKEIYEIQKAKGEITDVNLLIPPLFKTIGVTFTPGHFDNEFNLIRMIRIVTIKYVEVGAAMANFLTEPIMQCNAFLAVSRAFIKRRRFDKAKKNLYKAHRAANQIYVSESKFNCLMNLIKCMLEVDPKSSQEILTDLLKIKKMKRTYKSGTYKVSYLETDVIPNKHQEQNREQLLLTIQVLLANGGVDLAMKIPLKITEKKYKGFIEVATFFLETDPVKSYQAISEAISIASQEYDPDTDEYKSACYHIGSLLADFTPKQAMEMIDMMKDQGRKNALAGMIEGKDWKDISHETLQEIIGMLDLIKEPDFKWRVLISLSKNIKEDHLEVAIKLLNMALIVAAQLENPKSIHRASLEISIDLLQCDPEAGKKSFLEAYHELIKMKKLNSALGVEAVRVFASIDLKFAEEILLNFSCKYPPYEPFWQALRIIVQTLAPINPHAALERVDQIKLPYYKCLALLDVTRLIAESNLSLAKKTLFKAISIIPELHDEEFTISDESKQKTKALLYTLDIFFKEMNPLL